MQVCRSIKEKKSSLSSQQRYSWSNLNSIDTLVYKVITISQQIFLAVQKPNSEQYYESLLYTYLEKAGISALKQFSFQPSNQELQLESKFRCDLILNQKLLVEIKASNSCEPAFFAQLSIYQKLLGINHGLLINFAAQNFYQAIHRFYITN